MNVGEKNKKQNTKVDTVTNTIESQMRQALWISYFGAPYPDTKTNFPVPTYGDENRLAKFT